MYKLLHPFLFSKIKKSKYIEIFKVYDEYSPVFLGFSIFQTKSFVSHNGLGLIFHFG
jgi:hypothetical protein